MTEDSLNFISESREECTGLEDFHENYDNSAASNHTLPKNEGRLRALYACGSSCYECGQYRKEGLNDIDNTEDVNPVLGLENKSLHVRGASTDHAKDNHEKRNDIEPTTKLPTSMELSCVICWATFSATRGVLPCGHRFCFSCIQSWVDYMTSSQKASACPLCKAAFSSITRSMMQFIRIKRYIHKLLMIHGWKEYTFLMMLKHRVSLLVSHWALQFVAIGQASREPEDLLQRCNICWIQCNHSYCLDPPLLPWTCGNCKELQRLYEHIR